MYIFFDIDKHCKVNILKHRQIFIQLYSVFSTWQDDGFGNPIDRFSYFESDFTLEIPSFIRILQDDSFGNLIYNVQNMLTQMEVVIDEPEFPI